MLVFQIVSLLIALFFTHIILANMVILQKVPPYSVGINSVAIVTFVAITWLI